VDTARGGQEEQVDPGLAVEGSTPGVRHAPKEVEDPAAPPVHEGPETLPRLKCGGTYEIADARFLRIREDEETTFTATLLPGGRACFTIPPNRGIGATVHTPDAVVRVVGTIFTVAHNGRRTEVSVERGTVELLNLAGEVITTLTANQSYPEPTTRPPVDVPPGSGAGRLDLPTNPPTVNE
jgi:hypothetical protein